MYLIEKVIFSSLALIIVTGVVWAKIDLRGFEGFYVREDGPIEWLTVVALLFGAGLSLQRFWSFRGEKSKCFLLTMVLMALVFLFGAGEEISWGQRLFGVESPAFFKAHNSQGETNLHNLLVNGKSVNKIVFGSFLGLCVVFYFLILPFLYRFKIKIQQWVDKFGLPIPTPFHIGAYIALFLSSLLCVSAKRGELLELGGCSIFVMMVWFPYNRKKFMKR